MSKITAALAMTLFLAGCASPGGGAPSRTGGTKSYPLDTCLVTGTKLGSMGDPYVKVYGNQEVKFCCEPCVAQFEADQEKFLKMLPR